MKASELIAELQKLVAEHGDLDVEILHESGYFHLSIDRVEYRYINIRHGKPLNPIFSLV